MELAHFLYRDARRNDGRRHGVVGGVIHGIVWRAIFGLCGWCGSCAWLGASEPEAKALTVSANLLELASSRTAHAALQAEARFFWDQTPLRAGLTELSQLHKLSIWIDRELDPSQLITTPAAEPGHIQLESRLRQIAVAAAAEVGLIENVVYFGPPGKVARVQRAAVELHDALSRAEPRLAAQHLPWQWEELSTPEQQRAQLAIQWQIEITGALPHDLSHAGGLLRPTTLATQLSLLAGGFGLEGKCVGAGQIRLVPLDRRSRWQATYSKSAVHLRRLPEWKTQYPGSDFQLRDNLVSVLGVTNFHLELLATAAPATRAANALETARWGFEVRNAPLEAVLDKLAGSLGFALVWDPSVNPSMRQRLVSFQVEQATTDELLQEIARVGQLRIDRQQDRVTIGPPGPPEPIQP